MENDGGLIAANLAVLKQGAALLARLSEGCYAGDTNGVRPVGPQLRHVLEHYSCFLAGLGRGRIDYDERPREAALETDRDAARRRIEELVGGLTPLAAADLETPAAVRLACGLGAEGEQWSRSTVRRELQFLLSHTVHHFALIGLLLEQRGIDPGRDFGVAPSTLEHRREQSACVPLPG